MPKIRVLIGKNGKITIDAEGFIGPKCIEATQKLEEILSAYGIQLSNKQVHLKPEYHKVEVTEYDEVRT